MLKEKIAVKERLRMGSCFRPARLLQALCLAGELFFIMDMAFSRATANLSAAAALGTLLLGFALGLFLAAVLPRVLKGLLLSLGGLIAAAALIFCAALAGLERSGSYAPTDMDKQAVFGGRTVLALVPHQDDELNILGGVLEQFVDYGSQVYIVYMTNGDRNLDVEQRFAEAVAGMAECGIPESNLVLLGYGDGMEAQGQGVYAGEEDQLYYSSTGCSTTHGTASHPAFREGRAYTRANLTQDIRDVILHYKPDMIFCSDLDMHRDHQTLSLLFDRAMGEILQAQPDYTPTVFKGFAYSTAYEAPADFYALNMRSTQKPCEGAYMEESSQYSWDARLRLPVSARALARSIYNSSLYRAMDHYRSQYPVKNIESMINGDKVFWQRETGSLSYGADISASSGDAQVLNDFMLLDKRAGQGADGVWATDETDQERRITIRFDEAKALCRLVLYDNPSPEDNVLNVRVLFEDGSWLDTGPLLPSGAATEISFDRRDSTVLELLITETEGSRAGLTELEVYDAPFTAPFQLIKLVNSSGDFVYDYYLGYGGTEEFSLYAYGCSDDLEDYTLSCTGSRCSAEIVGDSIRVSCPPGQSCLLRIASRDGSVSDSVVIRGGGAWAGFAQSVEEYQRHEFRWAQNSNTVIFISRLYDMIWGGRNE